MNKKIALSGLSILTALALMGGAVFALFTDQATSQDNTFSTGNASLLIADDSANSGGPEDPVLPYGESIPGASFSDIAPGFSDEKLFWLKNDSTGDFSMDVTVDLDNVGVGGSAPGDLGDNLMIQFQCDTNGDGSTDSSTPSKSVNTWVTEGPEALPDIGPNDGFSGATTGSDQDELLCKMVATLDSGLGNEAAGESISFDGLFDGTQIAGP